jgi:hypothetical protein
VQFSLTGHKQIVEDLLQRIPDDASMGDIVREIEFVRAGREGLAELDRGERIPIQEAECGCAEGSGRSAGVTG